MPAVAETFKLLADPTRRRLLDLLLAGERSANELCTPFPISQQAVSLHLQALRKGRLVEVRKQGRYRKYRLRAEPVREIFEWSVRYTPFFDPFGHLWLFSPKRDEQPARRYPQSKTHASRGKSWS